MAGSHRDCEDNYDQATQHGSVRITRFVTRFSLQSTF
jgi:hypothetical protein